MSSHEDSFHHSAAYLSKQAKIYAAVLLSLFFLTAVTVAASYVDLGSANIVIAIMIATVKASLVALFFMHLIHDRPMNGMILLGAFGFLGLLLTFCLLDIDNRLHSPPSGKIEPSVHGPYEPVAPGAKVPTAAMPAETPAK